MLELILTAALTLAIGLIGFLTYTYGFKTLSDDDSNKNESSNETSTPSSKSRTKRKSKETLVSAVLHAIFYFKKIFHFLNNKNFF